MGRPTVPEGAHYDRVRAMQAALGGPLWGGAKLIFKERERQILREGWSVDHDAEHDGNELPDAALCYAMPADERDLDKRRWNTWRRIAVPKRWPWSAEFWKPTPDDRVRELVKAGALIAAEIDRLQAQKNGSSS